MADDLLDTSADAERALRALLQQRTGTERVRMASEMFDTARRLALASLPEAVREDPFERSAALVRRFYGRDLDPSVLRAVTAHLHRHQPLVGPARVLGREDRRRVNIDVPL